MRLAAVWATRFGTPVVPEGRSTHSGCPPPAGRASRIDVGSRDEGAQMVLRHVGGADDETAGDAVQFDHRQGRRELLAGGDENRAPLEGGEPAAEARAVDQIGKRYALARAPEIS